MPRRLDGQMASASAQPRENQGPQCVFPLTLFGLFRLLVLDLFLSRLSLGDVGWSTNGDRPSSPDPRCAPTWLNCFLSFTSFLSAVSTRSCARRGPRQKGLCAGLVGIRSSGYRVAMDTQQGDAVEVPAADRSGYSVASGHMSECVILETRGISNEGRNWGDARDGLGAFN